VPFTDPNIDGWLTFCNRNDQPVTSGSLYATPFAWKTISSAPPPPGYRNSKGRAALYGYQPLQYVNPGDWAGYELTGASSFSNPDHPVAQATNADLPLIGFTESYPLHWDGFAEIRMMWTSVNQAQLQSPYAAAIVRVTGNTWTLVEGGGGSCSQSTGRSDEVRALASKKLAKPETAVPVANSSASARRASTNPPVGSAASSPSSARSAGVGSAKLAAKDSSTGMSGGALAGIAVGALALIWAAIGAIAFWRRRRTVE
jgi:hypothetical protein